MDIKVELGMQYEVQAPFQLCGERLRRGDVLYAWFYGELIMLPVQPDGTLNHDLEYPATPNNILRLIKAGKLEMMKQVVVGGEKWDHHPTTDTWVCRAPYTQKPVPDAKRLRDYLDNYVKGSEA